MTPFALPTDYPRVRSVHSFDELAGTPFAAGVNALAAPVDKTEAKAGKTKKSKTQQ
jgi:hypothetical protein